MQTEQQLQDLIHKIEPPDQEAMARASRRWNAIAKPLHSLGRLEEDVIRIAGVTGSTEIEIKKKALLVFCADNGVVAEGVTQTGQDVTAVVAENFLTCNTSAALMCRVAGADVFPVDIGMAADTRVPDYKIARGTGNIRKEPAMSRDEAIRAILTGARLVRDKKEAGYQLLAAGEMGIGNTTTSSAVACALTGRTPEQMAGRGAGLSDEGLEKKKQVIREALATHRPDGRDPVDVLAKVGGFDLAGLTGAYLGAAACRIPMVLDGFISVAAALCAVRLCPAVREYLIPSHCSAEPGMRILLKELDMDAPLHCGMCLGEGSGAVAYFPLLEMGVEVYKNMSTFSENQIEAYKE